MSKLITAKVRLSFPQLIVPKAPTNKAGVVTGEARYGACFVWEPGDADLANVKKAIADAMVEKLGVEKASEYIKMMAAKSTKVKNPLHEDEDKRYGEGGHWYVNARNKLKPQVVDGSLKLLTDKEIDEKCYPGAYVRASLSFYWYDNESKGVGCGLNNLQWLADGERLDSRVEAKNEFDAVETPVADLAALMG